MKSIAICDDDRQQLQAALEELGGYLSARGVTVGVNAYPKVDQLLSDLDRIKPDLVFMDIEFDGNPEGIDAARVINDRLPECQVVYLTSYLHYAVDVYDTNHAWFVLKDQFAQRLPEIMDKLEAIESSRRARVVVTTKDSLVVNIPCSDIRYLERRDRITRIATGRSVYQVRERLPLVLERLPQTCFARCHNSFAVNMANVAEIHPSYLILDDGTKILVSRSYAKDFRKRFMDWAEAWTV